MFGWRARLGVVIPSANTTVEGEFNSYRPEGVSIHANRVKSTTVDAEGMLAMSAHAERAVVELVDASVETVVYACTSGTFTLGTDFGTQLEQQLEEQVGIPVITTATAVLAAIKAMGIDSLALVSPYTDEVNEQEVEFLRQNDIKVTASKGLGHRAPGPAMPLRRTHTSHIGLEPQYASYALAKRVYEESEPQAIFISCTNFPTFNNIAKIEADLGVPVVTSNQTSLWAALGLAGVDGKELKDLGLGYLFHEASPQHVRAALGKVRG